MDIPNPLEDLYFSPPQAENFEVREGHKEVGGKFLVPFLSFLLLLTLFYCENTAFQLLGP